MSLLRLFAKLEFANLPVRYSWAPSLAVFHLLPTRAHSVNFLTPFHHMSCRLVKHPWHAETRSSKSNFHDLQPFFLPIFCVLVWRLSITAHAIASSTNTTTTSGTFLQTRNSLIGERIEIELERRHYPSTIHP